MPDYNLKKEIRSRQISQSRRFNNQIYVTDFITYDSKVEAKSVVVFLKTKVVDTRARIIDKTTFFLIYFGEKTYQDIERGRLKVPEVSEIPEDIIEMVNENHSTGSSTEINQKKILSVEKTIMKIDATFRASGKPRNASYEVVQVDGEMSTTELMKKTGSIESNDDDDESAGINATMDYVENQFFKTCPKCGSAMKPNFIVLGPTGRMAVYQCRTCNFYLPRSISQSA